MTTYLVVIGLVIVASPLVRRIVARREVVAHMRRIGLL
jgi:hypothetical protein